MNYNYFYKKVNCIIPCETHKGLLRINNRKIICQINGFAR